MAHKSNRFFFLKQSLLLLLFLVFNNNSIDLNLQAMKAAETDIKSQLSVAQNPIRLSHEEKSELSLSGDSHFKFLCIV